MSDEQMVAIWNEWLRRYIEEPERFKHEFLTILEFIRAEGDGRTPTYGEECLAYMKTLHIELYPPAAHQPSAIDNLT